MSRRRERAAFTPETLRELAGAAEGLLAGDFLGGAWDAHPWFCEDEDSWFTEAGFPLWRRRDLVQPLRQLYPPAICRRILRRPLDAALVFGLFQRMPGFLIPLLEVAGDRAAFGSLEGDRIQRKLRSRDDFSSAASELSVWADLVRAGFHVDREPGVLVDGNPKHPDFGVRTGADYFHVETSQLQPSAWERAADRLEWVLGALPNLFLEGRAISLVPNSGFLGGLAKALAGLFEVQSPQGDRRADEFIQANIAPAVSKALQQAKAAGGRPGAYPIEGVGEVKVLVDGQTSADVELMPQPTHAEVAQRVWRKILDEAGQLTQGRVRVAGGIVVIDVGRAMEILPVVDAVLADLRRGRPEGEFRRMEGVDAILLRGNWTKPSGERAHAVHILLKGKHAPAVSVERIARGVGGGYLVNRKNGGGIQGPLGEFYGRLS
jgi:hypothetical protein